VIALFVGSFNPVTLAHAEIVERIKQLENVSKVIVIPVSNYYSKPGLVVSGKHRFKMLQLALPETLISDFEIKQKRQLKSLETLNHFQSLFLEPLALVIGADNFANFHTWYRYQEILSKYYLIVISRQSDVQAILDHERYNNYRHKIIFINDINLDISSTKAKATLDRKYLCPQVIEYIHKNHLYTQ